MCKLLVPGLAIGAEPGIDACQPCNIDISWIFRNPASFLYSEKIILTPLVHKMVSSDDYVYHDNSSVNEIVGYLFNKMLKANNYEVRKPQEVISKEIKNKIFKAIEGDFNKLLEQGSEEIRWDDTTHPGHLYINDNHYCVPIAWATYACMFLAKSWKADLVFRPDEINYFERVLGLHSGNIAQKNKAFDEIFSCAIPDIRLMPETAVEEKCKQCEKIEKCEEDLLGAILKEIDMIFEWREYDEINSMRHILSEISNAFHEEGHVTAKEIIRSYREEESRLRLKMGKIFPKAKRWLNISTVLFLPFAVAGVTSGSSTISGIGAGGIGLTEVVKQYLNYKESEYGWVGFKIESNTIVK